MKKLFNKKGFTLIELLVVIAIIAALAVVVFAAINPGKRLREARNSRRTVDATTILDSLHTAIVDLGGVNPGIISANLVGGVLAETQIGTGTTGISGTCAGTAALANTATLTGHGCAFTASRACIDLAGAIVGPVATGVGISAYMSSNPIDPNTTLWNATRTGYTITTDGSGIITIKNCNTETATANTMTQFSVSR